MKAVVAAFSQEKALVGAFSMIVQPVVEPMDRFTALIIIISLKTSDPDLAAHLGVELGEEVCPLLGGDVATLLVGDHLQRKAVACLTPWCRVTLCLCLPVGICRQRRSRVARSSFTIASFSCREQCSG